MSAHNDKTKPTPKRLRDVLAAYGASPHRWPAEERAGLQTVLDAHPELQEAVAEAAALDDLLDGVPAYEPRPEALAEALAIPADRDRGWLDALWPFGPLWQPALPLAASLLLGLVVGMYLPGLETSQTAWNGDTDDVSTSAMEDWL